MDAEEHVGIELRFDDAAREVLQTRPTEVAALDAHPDFDHAVPTPDHFLPLLYIAGLAAAQGQGADVLVDGYAFGSLSMISYTLDARCPERTPDLPGSAPLSREVPADASNI